MEKRYTAEEAEVLNGWFIDKPEFKDLYEKYFAIEQAGKVNRSPSNNTYHISECMAGGLLLTFEKLHLKPENGEYL